MIWEIGRQRHKDVSAKVGLNRDQPEQLVDKDNHAWDGLKMFLQRFPPTPKTQAQAAQGNTFRWWQSVAKKAADGKPIPTFRRVPVG